MKRFTLLLLLLPALTFGAAQKLLPSTAAQTVLFGPVADSADGSRETGLTIDETDILVCQDSASCGDKNETTDLAHAGAGVYTVTLDATDTAATESVCIILEEAGTLPLMQCYEIEAAGFAGLRAGSTELLTSDMVGLAAYATVDTATSQTEFILDSGPSNNDAIPAGSAVMFKGGGEVCNTTATDYVGSTTTLHVTACTSIMTVAAADEVFVYTNLSAPVGQDTNADVAVLQTTADAIETDTSEIGSAVNGSIGTDISLVAADAAAILADTGTDGVVLAAGSVNATSVADNAIDAGAIASNAIAGAKIASGALSEAKFASDFLTAAKIAADVTTEIQAGVVLATGTCDSGTTTTCVDAALTQADDIWKGAAIVFTTLGETACVYDFTAADDTLTFWALQTDIGTETFVLVESALCESATDESP